MCDFVKASFLTCSIQKQMQECKHECTFTYLKLHGSIITQLLDEISKKNIGVLLIFISQELVPVFSSPSPAPCLLSSHRMIPLRFLSTLYAAWHVSRGFPYVCPLALNIRIVP